jgi:hypothetical protein
MSENTMMLVQSTWNDKQTFRMIPIAESCPYVECIFDPDTKVLVAISKITKTSLHMLPKLDDYGQPITGAKGMKQDRHKIEVFVEFYLEDETAIEDLIKLFTVNKDSFDYKKFLGSEASEKPKKGAK